MNTAPNLQPNDDEGLVLVALAELRRPRDIRNVVYDFGTDYSGDPAVWIWVEIAPDTRPSDAKVTRLSDYTLALSDRLLDQGIRSWPYVNLRDTA